jgi:hypothetical protein
MTTSDFFRASLEHLIDLSHALAVPSRRLPLRLRVVLPRLTHAYRGSVPVRALGGAGIKPWLKTSIEAAVAPCARKQTAFERVIVTALPWPSSAVCPVVHHVRRDQQHASNAGQNPRRLQLDGQPRHRLRACRVPPVTALRPPLVPAAAPPPR